MRLSCAASGKIGLVSVHLCDSSHRASSISPRLKRGMTRVFTAEERKLLCPKPLRAADSTQGGASQWVHVPWGNCASPSPSHEGVALLVARTCNEVVPAHKKFLRARQTPVPLIRNLLGACMYRTRYQVCCTRNERLETGVRTTSTRIV